MFPYIHINPEDRSICVFCCCLFIHCCRYNLFSDNWFFVVKYSQQMLINLRYTYSRKIKMKLLFRSFLRDDSKQIRIMHDLTECKIATQCRGRHKSTRRQQRRRQRRTADTWERVARSSHSRHKWLKMMWFRCVCDCGYNESARAISGGGCEVYNGSE